MLDILIFMLELTGILILGLVIAMLMILIITTIIITIQEAKDKIKERKEKC